MKTKAIFKSLLFTLAIIFTYGSVNAQGMGARKSPHQTVKGSVNGANITITYGSPGVKGRTIWGGLVPYDKPWRAGADEATTLETDKAIKVNGQTLPAGKYTLFATPGKDKWTIILNSETGQWGIKRTGDANFDPAKNVASFEVTPQKDSGLTEQLTYEINNSGIVMHWEHFTVPIALQ